MSIENPPAFPSETYVPELAANAPGMTLRDYFAGQALAGLLHTEPKASPSDVASWAYLRADAMLTARQKGTPDE